MDNPENTASDSTKNATLNGAAAEKRKYVINQNKENGRNIHVRNKKGKTEYETAAFNLFEGAREKPKFYALIKDVDDRDGKRFTDLNYKDRMLSIYSAIDKDIESTDKIRMNRFQRFRDKYVSVQVEFTKVEDMNKLITCDNLAGMNVLVSPNIGKNSVKGIIRDREESLKDMSNKDIMEAINTEHNVVEVKRLGKNVICVSFMGQERPKEIKVWENMLIMKVDEHIRPPAKCYKCQQFVKHTGANCQNDYVCFKCGTSYKNEGDHDPKACKKESKCIHCGGRHWSGAMSCPVTKRELQWDVLVKETGKSRYEVKQRYPTGERVTYSSATSSSNFSFGNNINTPSNSNSFTFTNTSTGDSNGVRRDEDMELSQNESPAVKTILERLQSIEDKIKTTEEVATIDTVQVQNKEQEPKDREWMTLQLDLIRQENKTQLDEMTGRINEQATQLQSLQDKVTRQEELIEQQKSEIEEKDQIIQQLKDEKEALIVQTDRLHVNADKTVINENAALKLEIKNLKEELVVNNGREKERKKSKADKTNK